MAELRDGVRLQKLRPVKGQLQEERKHALLIELVQCEAGKNMKFVSSRLLPYAFSFFCSLIFLRDKLGHQDFPLLFSPLYVSGESQQVKRKDIYSVSKLSSKCS